MLLSFINQYRCRAIIAYRFFLPQGDKAIAAKHDLQAKGSTQIYMRVMILFSTSHCRSVLFKL